MGQATPRRFYVGPMTVGPRRPNTLKDTQAMNEYRMDPNGRGMTVAGLVCSIIGTVIGALYLAYFAFLVVMLIIIEVNGPAP